MMDMSTLRFLFQNGLLDEATKVNMSQKQSKCSNSSVQTSSSAKVWEII